MAGRRGRASAAVGGSGRAAIRTAGPQAPPSPATPAPARDHQIELLQRRLDKLRRLLELRESELGRLAAAGEIEPGLASIYRTVQGLEGDDETVRRKREMMARIFDANLQLQLKLRAGEHFGGPSGR